MMINNGRCIHSKNKISPIKKLENYYFCINCGSIIYSLSENKSYIASKPLSYQQNIEIDPLTLYNTITVKDFKIVNPTHPYFKNRPKAISLLQKYSEFYKYSESSFYLALHYMDYIFSHIEKNIPQKKFELYVINCFLLAVKFYEKDIIQPDIPIYTSIGISYDIDEYDINQNEIECLKLLQYDLNLLNSFDLLLLFMNNGFVFENEIENKSNEFSNIIYCYGKKIFSDIILTPIAIQFKPIEICFSIVHLSRKQFGLNNQYFNIVKKFYNIHLTDYKKCLNSIKKFLDNPNITVIEQVKQKPSQSSKYLVPLLTNKKKENEKNEEKKDNDEKEKIKVIENRRNSLEEDMKTPENINKGNKKKVRIDSFDLEKEKNNIIEKKITATLNFQKHKRASSSSFINKLDLIEEDEIMNFNSSSKKSCRLFRIDFNENKRSKSKENKKVIIVTIKVDNEKSSIFVPKISRKSFKKQRSLFYKNDKEDKEDKEEKEEKI